MSTGRLLREPVTPDPGMRAEAISWVREYPCPCLNLLSQSDQGILSISIRRLGIRADAPERHSESIHPRTSSSLIRSSRPGRELTVLTIPPPPNTMSTTDTSALPCKLANGSSLIEDIYAEGLKNETITSSDMKPLREQLARNSQGMLEATLSDRPVLNPSVLSEDTHFEWKVNASSDLLSPSSPSSPLSRDELTLYFDVDGVCYTSGIRYELRPLKANIAFRRTTAGKSTGWELAKELTYRPSTNENATALMIERMRSSKTDTSSSKQGEQQPSDEELRRAAEAASQELRRWCPLDGLSGPAAESTRERRSNARLRALREESQ